MPPPPRHPPAGPQAADALAAVAPLLTTWISRLLAREAPVLTVPRFLALRAIHRERVSVSEIARRTGVSGPAASQLIGSLADDGLIEREPDPADRRRHTLRLSTAGRRATEAAEARLRTELGALLTDLPRPEVDALARALPSLEAALSGSPPPRRPPPPPPPHGPPGPHHPAPPGPRRRA